MVVLIIFLILRCVWALSPELDCPYQVAIAYQGNHVCTGALVDYSIAVTTARCVNELNISEFRVSYGLDLDHQSDSLKLMKIVVHPTYTKDAPYHHDIALIQFYGEFPGTDVTLIRLKPHRINEDMKVVFSGWGTVNAVSKSELQILVLNTLGECLCNDIFPTSNRVHIFNFCGVSRLTDTCILESGSTLHHYNVLVGILSWGIPCDTRRIQAVFIRISHYMDWLQTVVKRLQRV